MSHKSITLRIPDALYERLQETAEASDRSIEAVVLESIDVIFQPDMNLPTLDALPSYSDDQLWAVVLRRLSWSQSLRLRELSANIKQQALNEAERHELQHLLDLVDHLMLLRSEALLLLKERGQQIDSYLKLGA